MAQDDESTPLGRDESVMLAAFEGWNDAGSAASSALEHLHVTWAADQVATLDPEEYHDFQVARPSVTRNADGDRVISWPGTVISSTTGPWLTDRRLTLVRGIEPSMRWRHFVAEILDHAEKNGVTTLICVGALLVDVPHTRPLPTFASSESKAARERYDLERSDYEGPTGILGVLAHEAERRGILVISLWAGVPHYVANPPSPKATLALLSHLERLLGEPIELGELAYDAEAWQAGADELTEDDEDITAHVRHLESLMDETSLPEATGDAIAAEFERFLRKRDGGPGPGR